MMRTHTRILAMALVVVMMVGAGCATMSLVETIEQLPQALAKGDYRGAIGLLGQYVRGDQGNVSAWLDLGKAYWSAGDRADALTAFRRVLELAPTNEEARRFLLGR